MPLEIHRADIPAPESDPTNINSALALRREINEILEEETKGLGDPHNPTDEGLFLFRPDVVREWPIDNNRRLGLVSIVQKASVEGAAKSEREHAQLAAVRAFLADRGAILEHVFSYHSIDDMFREELLLTGFEGYQEGMIEYDPTNETQPLTFCIDRAKWLISRYYRSFSRTIRLPDGAYDDLTQISLLARDLDRKPTIDEIVASTELSRAAVKRLLAIPILVSLDEEIRKTNRSTMDQTRYDSIPDPRPEANFEEILISAMSRKHDREAIINALDRLDGRRRDIIERRFGIGHKVHTLEEIGAKYGISKQAVFKSMNATLRMLRRMLEQQGRKTL